MKKNLASPIIFIIILFVFYYCYTKIKLPENDIKTQSINKLQNESNKNIVVINENYSFYKTFEDLPKNRLKFGNGTYYMFDYYNYSYNWNDITDLIYDLFEQNIYPLDIWYKGCSSSCVDFKSGTAFYMSYKSKLIIRLKNPDHTINDLGFKITHDTHFGCPYHIMHYARIEKEVE